MEPANTNENIDENDYNDLADNLAESIEYLSQITPTTMPKWMN